jgi:hypothetical protein
MTANLLRASALPALMLAAACGGDPTAAPSAPTPVASNPSSAPQPPTPVTRHLNGLVLDESGMPLPGARVEVFSASSSPAVTDGNGYYDLAAMLMVSGHVFGTDVTITKAGYEDTHAWVPGLDDLTQDFRLYRIMNITAGQSVHLAITPDNSLCGFEEEFRCRTLHVVAPSSGTLVLDTIADDPSTAFWIVIGDRFNVQYPFRGVIHISVSMNEQSTATVQILRPWQAPLAPQGFMLETSLTR